MVADEGDPASEFEDGVIGRKVVSPKERLLTKLDGGREETEHCPENRECKQHRQTSSHGVHARPSVEVHRGLLLLHCIFLLGIALVELLNFRLESLHLGRRSIGLVGERKNDHFDEESHQQDDYSVVRDALVQEIEQWDDDELGEPADEPAAKGNYLFELAVVFLKGIVMAGAEIHVHGHGQVLTGTEITAHPGIAGHEVAVGIFLGEEGQCEIAFGKSFSGAENGAEELLLESEPLDLGINSLAAVPATSDFNGFLVPGLVEIKLGILRLVLEALLHTGNGHGKIHIQAGDIARDAVHSHEGKLVVGHVRPFFQTIALLDITTVGEIEPEGGLVFFLPDDLEIEIARADILSRVNAYGILAHSGFEKIERSAVVIIEILDLHAVRLGAAAGKFKDYLVVLKGHNTPLARMGLLKTGILIDRRLLSGRGLLNRRFGHSLRIGSRIGNAVGFAHQLKGIRDTLLFSVILFRLFALIKGESEKDCSHQDETCNCILVHI